MYWHGNAPSTQAAWLPCRPGSGSPQGHGRRDWSRATYRRDMRGVMLMSAFGLVTLGLTACGNSTPTTAGMCAPGPGISQTVSTSSYTMVLDVGGREKMYTEAEARAEHPTEGEIMLRGEMAMVDQSDPASVRHLEVHVCNRVSGQVVTDLNPDITLVDNSGGDMTDHVPTLVMQGITSGQADLHYGNMVTMPAGHDFTVMVAVDGQPATFHVTTPPAS